MSADDLSQFSMMDLFRAEAEGQTAILTSGLLELEQDPVAGDRLEGMMRAAHSLKGAARIINLEAAVSVAHALEDCFVAAQKGALVLRKEGIDLLLRGVDLLTRIAETPEPALSQWEAERRTDVDGLVEALVAFEKGEKRIDQQLEPSPALSKTATDLINQPGGPPEVDSSRSIPEVPESPMSDNEVRSVVRGTTSDRVLRVTADHLNRLLGLAGESLVESRWLNPFTESLLRLKRQQFDLGKALDLLRDALSAQTANDPVQSGLTQVQDKFIECRQFLGDRLLELESFKRRSANLSHRLYNEALACRMRPFADGIQGFPRMVRDLAHSLGKEIKLEIIGEATQVDRDVLEKLEAPLNHLLRNSIDHGIEAPETRMQAGKAKEGAVRLEARHSAGMLLIIVSDDGKGVCLGELRHSVVAKKLTDSSTAEKLSESELLEFLFLPGFTMKQEVTEISGRGVGLDVVQSMIKNVRGSVRVSTDPGKGTRFQLQLPLTLSVMRTLLAEVDGEPYAFPLAYIVRSLKLPKSQIEVLEGRQHFRFDDRQVGLITARQVLRRGEWKGSSSELPVIVLGVHGREFGLVVDHFLGERELVVHPLDPRLGKIKDIAAGALMEDGAPVLIMDVEDVIRSIEKLTSTGALSKVQGEDAGIGASKRKRVLVVDDSLTVRELERKLLASGGYEVDVAVDGMDGWNAIRTGHYDLIVSDVDMPRLDGIELVTLIKKDPHLRSLPVMIVSYKDREEDRQRGLEVGADYYLTKGSFHDETLLQAVADLIGEA